MSLLALVTAMLIATTWASTWHSTGRAEKRAETHGSRLYSEKEILKAIAGTYSLINTTSARNGKPVPDAPNGKHPAGILIYLESGWMSALTTATEPELRPAKLTYPFKPEDSDADWALVGKHSLAYSGPLSVSDAIPATPEHGQVIHGPLVVANVPSWVHSSQRRNYTLHRTSEGTLLNIRSDRGNGNTGELWWRKLE